MPDPIDAVLARTDADGNAQVRFQVPSALNLAGFVFPAQWALAAQPLLAGLVARDRLRGDDPVAGQ